MTETRAHPTRASSATVGSPPRLVLVLLIALALAMPLAGCGSEPPATLEIERLEETQRLFVEAESSVGEPYGDVQVLRTLALEPQGADAYVLKPLDVYVHGDRYGTNEAGERVVIGSSAGLDRAAQAASQPHLTPYWGSARASSGGRLDLGLLLPDGSFFAPFRAPAYSKPAIDDALPFLVQRIPDEVLPLVVAHAPGSWPVGRELTVDIEIHRGNDESPLKGKLTLRRSGGPSWKLHLKVLWHVTGAVTDLLPWRVHHHVSGFVAVQPTGRIATATLSSRTRVVDGAEELGTSRHRMELGPSEPTAKGDEAGELARLLALRAEGKDAFDEAVLALSARSAQDIVRRVRPDANVDDVTVLLSDKVDPSAWPAGRPSSTANLDVCISLWARWAPTIDQLLGTAMAPGDTEVILVADAEHARMYGVDFEEREWEPEGEEFAYAWPHLGRIAAGRAVISDLRVLAHEFGHVANERFGYPDLPRVGFSWEDGELTWIDLDGLLALSVLEEAQAQATALCAALACFEAHQHRWIIRWFGRQDPTPSLQSVFRDRLSTLAYGPSAAVLNTYCTGADDLEAVVAKTWAASPYQTKKLILPKEDVLPSQLWPRAQSLKGEAVSDATRVGAFALLFHLDGGQEHRREEALAIVSALEDDVLLRAKEGGHLWLTAWQDEAAARRFVDPIEGPSAGTVEQDGRYVTVQLDGVPKAEAWLRHLLGPEDSAEAVGEPAGAPSAEPAAAGSR